MSNAQVFFLPGVLLLKEAFVSLLGTAAPQAEKQGYPGRNGSLKWNPFQQNRSSRKCSQKRDQATPRTARWERPLHR